MPTPQPRECVEFKPLLKLPATTAYSVECEVSEPPPPGGPEGWKCLGPYPSKVKVTFSTGDNKLGVYPLTFPPQVYTYPYPNYNEGTTVNTTSTVEATGNDPEWSLTFVRNDLIVARIYDIIGPLHDWNAKRTGVSPFQSSPYDTIIAQELDVEAYYLEEVKYGQTVMAHTVKTYAGWYAADPTQFQNFSATPNIMCQSTLEYDSEYIHVFVGSMSAICNIVPVGRIEYPDEGVVSFAGTVASGFVAKRIGNMSKFRFGAGIDGSTTNGFFQAAGSTYVGHGMCLGLLPSYVMEDPSIPPSALFTPNQFYNGPYVGFPNPPAWSPTYPESLTAYNYIGWPKYGQGNFSFSTTRNGSVINLSGGAINGIGLTPGPLSILPPIANPVTVSVEVTP